MMIYDRDCRVSDLIEKLNFIEREYGDVEVRLYDKYLRDYYDFALDCDDKECTCNITIMDEPDSYRSNLHRTSITSNMEYNDDKNKYDCLKGESDVMFFRMRKSIDP